jgi:predicted ATPase/DNA-binding SARP family transcriptional activator
MEFHILGPFEVEDRGGLLHIGSPAECDLLALLVCLANETVPVERIIDELWGDDPPATARNMVQRYVSRLRKSLGQAAAERLSTRAGGYSLRVSDVELDSSLFESKVKEARGLDNRSESSSLLHQALALWRGSALAGVGDGRTLVVERVRLEEARVSALEDRIDCDLGLGRHHDLLSELEGLCSLYPLRERLRSHLILALYRCDRQAEALRSYTDYRLVLGEETGLDPSPALVELENRILARSPDLDVVSPVGSPITPTNLPYRITRFIGRRSEIEAVVRQVNEHRLVTLVGTGGIGKTSIAVRVAAEMAAAFPDGVWLIDLAPLADASLIGSTAVGVLHARATPREDSLDAVVRHLREQTVLLVLDNCEHLIDGAARFANTVLRSTRNVRVLATSRESLSVSGELIVRVPSLEVPDLALQEPAAIANSEAVELFTDRAQLLRQEFRIDNTNAVAVAEVCRKLDGIPLAVELAAARLGTMPVAEIAACIENRYYLLTRGARTAPQRHRTLQAMVDWSHELLTSDEQVLLRRLAVFAGGFTADTATFVCGFEPLTQDTVLGALEQLVDASLVIPPDPPADRFGVLETIREYCRHHLDSSGETEQVMRRLGGYLVEAGPGADDGGPGSDYASWFRWRDDEQSSFRVALTWSIGAGDADLATALTIEFHTYLAHRTLGFEAAFWVGRALALVDNETSHRHLQLSSMEIADVLILGDRANAVEKVQSLYREARTLRDDGAMGYALLAESVLASYTGDLATALEKIDESLEHFHATTNVHAPKTQARRAFYLTRLGRYSEAKSSVDKIVEEASRLGNRADDRYAQALSNLYGAMIAFHQGELDEAEQLLNMEDEYFRQFGPDGLLGFLWARWHVALARGDTAAASAAAAELTEALPESATPEILRDAATLRALCALVLVGPAAASPHLREAVKYARQDDSVIENADSIIVVADTAVAAGDHLEATRLYAAASAVYQRSGVVLAQWQQQRMGRSLEALQEMLEADQFNDVWSQGSALTSAEMVDLADDYLNHRSGFRRPETQDIAPVDA